MKKLVFLFTLIFLITSCEKEEFFNYVRFKNLHAQDIQCVVSGIDFGIVTSGSTTQYKKVPGGEGTFSGQLQGDITLQENNKLRKDRYYTVTIEADGDLSLQEDT